MAQYIDKAALVAEIERRIESCARQREDMLNVQCHTLADDASARMGELRYFQDYLNTLKVKEVDLEKEINKYICGNFFGSQTLGFFANRTKKEPNDQDIALCARHFFELGMCVNSPITAADRGTVEEIIINLKRVEQDYRINLTKEMEWLRNQVKKGK